MFCRIGPKGPILPLTLVLFMGPGCSTNPIETAPSKPAMGAPSPGAGDGGVTSGEDAERKVYYGTRGPSHVALTPGQIMAVGTYGFCSGLLITPRWVLSASHCGLRRGHEFCMGDDPGDPKHCVDVIRAIDHRSVDMALTELVRDAREVAPGVEPVPLFTGTLDDSWIGQTAEASGYGRNEHGNYGRRAFTAQPIVRLSGSSLTIDGQGRRGVCFGDSGGPVFVTASDGSTRVAGDLSGGDSSCVGRDSYTRVDAQRDWIERYTGPTIPPGPQPCGEVDAVGQCNPGGGSVSWCEDEVLQRKHCTEGTTCGWSTPDTGWRCLRPEEDSCQGVRSQGRCDDGTLKRCENGVLKSTRCADQGEVCRLENEANGYVCMEHPCGDLDYIGRCNGNVAEWCKNDEPQRMDCAAEGQICDHISDEKGYYCLDEDECGSLSYEGRCDGNVSVWCGRRGRQTRDCSDTNRTCQWVNDNHGHTCSDCGDVNFQGHCEGDVIHWCNRDGQLEAKDCGNGGLTCGLLNREEGNWCVERGQRPAPEPNSSEPDTDKDGIVDGTDRCRDTPRGATVWASGEWVGCSEGQYQD